MCLSDLTLNEIGIVEKINNNSKLSKRLSALGCVEGTKVKVKGYAPLGDPMIINLRGFDLAIRKKDAQHILICS